jgi:hypothetical protein
MVVQPDLMNWRSRTKGSPLLVSVGIVVSLWAVLFLVCVCLTVLGSMGPWPRKPAPHLANEIEAKLIQVPCVGPMARWERHYVFSSKQNDLALFATFFLSDRWFNYRSVDIDYRQAGFEEFRAGRVLGQAVRPAADDRQYDLVFGHYDVPSHTAYLWACGPNVPADTSQNIVVH